MCKVPERVEMPQGWHASSWLKRFAAAMSPVAMLLIIRLTSPRVFSRLIAPREFAGWQLGVKYASAAILVRSGALLRKQCFDRWSRRVSPQAAGLLVQALDGREFFGRPCQDNRVAREGGASRLTG
jgi:hypothetical protein